MGLNKVAKGTTLENKTKIKDLHSRRFKKKFN